MLRLTTQVQNLRTVWSGELAKVKAGVTNAIDQAAGALQQDVRGATASLGPKIVNAWRRERFPRGRDSLNAAAVVWSRAPKIVDAANRGAVIRGRRGKWLAIPLPAAGRGAGGKRITPVEFAKRRGVKLRFVEYGGRARAMLVVDGGRLDKRGLAQRNRSRARIGARGPLPQAGATTIPVFLLFRQVKMKKLLNLAASASTAAARVAATITRSLG